MFKHILIISCIILLSCSSVNENNNFIPKVWHPDASILDQVSNQVSEVNWKDIQNLKLSMKRETVFKILKYPAKFEFENIFICFTHSPDNIDY
jgi:hypothetical protein